MFEHGLEARILWHSLGWLSFLKWPSAHEVDFGDFIAEFDFKENVVRLRYSDGAAREIASFSPQQGRAAVSTIVGEIRCGNYSVESVSFRLLIKERGKPSACELSYSEGNGVCQYDDRLLITPVVNGRDAFLQVDYQEGVFELAVIASSLLVFNRFASS